MSSTEGRVELEIRGEIAWLTFDRAAARNAMTWPMYEQLDAHIERIAREPGVRLAVIRGANHTFVAGTDIAQFTTFASGDDGVDYERRLERIVGRVEALPVPILAVVEGHATGAGLILAAVSDLRVCTPDARFGMPIARTVGNCLSIANHARLIAAFGGARTKALILTAEMINAADAHACGFVAEIVPADQFDVRVNRLCERIAANAPITMATTREAVRRILRSALPDGEDLIRQAYGSRDFREGVAAFLAKRPPEWRGE
jgi:enoyl-CoA hydratase/carnithine racemase